MKGPKELLESEDNWVTRMGAWFPGERVVYRGKDLFAELKDYRWMGLFLYGITGREFSDNQISLFEGLWILCSSYPDPRLWNNRVAALAGTTRSTNSLGISAAIAISEASIYGRKPDVRAIDFLYRVHKKINEGDKLLDLIKTELYNYRIIPGYGRPVVRNDERIIPVMRLAEKLGCSQGQYVKLAFDIEKILINGRWRMSMNVAALAAALAADQGLSPREYHSLATPCFIAGIVPCLHDAIKKPEGNFLPLRCNRIKYEGKSYRKW